MTHPIDRAAQIVGSITALAAELGVSKGAVSQWKEESRRVPAEHCPVIERVTNRAVTCEELRPDVDWAFVRANGERRTHARRQTAGGRRATDTLPDSQP